jgi:hypothetical protein
MKKKLIGVYLAALLIMLCTYIPFNLMKSFINSNTHTETLRFVRQMGHAEVWYNFNEYGYVAVINYRLLIIQIIIITMIFAIVYLFLPKKPSNLEEKKLFNSGLAPTKRKVSKKAIIIISAVFIISIICATIGIRYKNYKIQQQKVLTEYDNNLIETQKLLSSGIANLKPICDKNYDVWKKAIKNGNNVKEELQKLDMYYMFNGDAKKITIEDNIKRNMRKIQNPPTKFKDIYKVISDMYDEYNRLYGLSIIEDYSSYGAPFESNAETVCNHYGSEIKDTCKSFEELNKKMTGLIVTIKNN